MTMTTKKMGMKRNKQSQKADTEAHGNENSTERASQVNQSTLNANKKTVKPKRRLSRIQGSVKDTINQSIQMRQDLGSKSSRKSLSKQQSFRFMPGRKPVKKTTKI